MANPYEQFITGGTQDNPYQQFVQSETADRFGTFATPQNAKELAPALRRAADLRLAGEGAGDAGRAALAEGVNTAFLNIPRNIAAFARSVQSGEPFSAEYERLRDIEEARARLNPKASIAGTVAGIGTGAVLLPGLGGAATTAGRAAQAAVTGAGYAGAGTLFDTKDPVQAAISSGLGAGLGIVAAPVAEKIVGLVSKMVRRGMSETRFLNPDGTLTPEAVAAARSAGVEPSEFQAVLSRAYAAKFAERGASPASARDAAADEFGIKLSPGQSSDDFTRIKYEQDAARGGYGPFATRAARRFGEEQAEQIGQARAGIQQDVAGGQVLGSVDEASGAVASGVRTRAASDKAGYKAAYDDAFAREGEFSDLAFRGIGERIRRHSLQGDSPVVINDKVTPIAASAIQHIDDRIGQLRIQDRVTGSPSSSDIVGISMKGAEQARKELLSFLKSAKASGNAEDMRAVRRVIAGFDDELESAISVGLFRGDESALPALKKARGMFAEYQRKFRPQGAGDDAGRAMEKIIERDATAGDVANMLYGKTVIGEKGSSVRIAQRMKQVLGDGEEWSAVKQSLWMRLTSKPEGMDDFGPQAMSQRIFKFLGGDGADLARVLFKSDELGKMRRFAAAIRNVVPPKDAVNWSGTAYTLAALQGGGLGGASLYFGGDPATAASLAALRVGGKFGRDVLRGRSASRYFASGVPRNFAPAGTGASAPTGVGAGVSLD